MVGAAITSQAIGKSRPASPSAQRWLDLVEQVSRHARQLRRELAEKIGPHEISEAQFSVLWACLKAPPGGLGQTEIAAELALSQAHVSCVVEQLRQRELLHSRRCDSDRRRQLWQITAIGENTLARLVVELNAAGCSPADETAVAEVLRVFAMLSGEARQQSGRLALHVTTDAPGKEGQAA